MRGSRGVWWMIEVGVPAVGVMVGVSLLAGAASAMVMAAPRALQWSLFAWGFASWAGGIAWGALVNDGIPGLRDA